MSRDADLHKVGPDLVAILAEARRHLAVQPALAATLALDALRIAPAHSEARLTRGAALRRTGDAAGAREWLAPLAAEQPRSWGAHCELGLALAMAGAALTAAAALRRAVELNPRSSLAWHALGDQLLILGDEAGAHQAHGHPAPGSIHDPALADAARVLFDQGEDTAASILRDRFGLHLTDLAAARLLGDVGLRLGMHEAVERFVTPRLHQAPDFLPLRYTYIVALQRQHRFTEALAAADRLPDKEAGVASRSLKAALRMQLEDDEGVLRLCRSMLDDHPDRPRIWIGYGHVLKTVGRRGEAIEAYRRALTISPELGEAYWSLANLKVVRFAAEEVVAMRRQLDRPDLGREDRVRMHFALGKALEDAGDFKPSFDQYRLGNALRRTYSPYDVRAHHSFIEQSISTFTPAFFAARQGSGEPASDPIFIVGLPRSGSTLVEQMLASHPAVEGAAELPYLPAIADRLARSAGGDGSRTYLAALDALDPSDLAAAGRAYLEAVCPHRRLGRPYLVDKTPGNVLHIGLIQLILPNAKIVDVRRDPLPCCVSNYKQLFGEGQAFTYDLGDLGSYYADYVALTAHFDRVLPGRIHRLSYETLVRQPEAELRRLLDYCGLPFDRSCMDYAQTARPVRTASSEQVRGPLFLDGLDQWRHFEPWLDPLKHALGLAEL